MAWVVYSIVTNKVLSVHNSKEDAKFECILHMNTLYKESNKKKGDTV